MITTKLTVAQVKAYKDQAIELTNNQFGLLQSFGYFKDREVSPMGWTKLGMDSNNVFIIQAGEIKMHYVVMDDCSELLTHADARSLILKHLGETI